MRTALDESTAFAPRAQPRITALEPRGGKPRVSRFVRFESSSWLGRAHDEHGTAGFPDHLARGGPHETAVQSAPGMGSHHDEVGPLLGGHAHERVGAR